MGRSDDYEGDIVRGGYLKRYSEMKNYERECLFLYELNSELVHVK